MHGLRWNLDAAATSTDSLPVRPRDAPDPGPSEQKMEDVIKWESQNEGPFPISKVTVMMRVMVLGRTFLIIEGCSRAFKGFPSDSQAIQDC